VLQQTSFISSIQLAASAFDAPMSRPTTELAEVRALEELTLATSPAIYERYYDGWVLRASHTDTRRANSTTALYESTLPLAEKIDFCEAWYRLHQQPTIIRLTAPLSPAGLDDALAARGYVREGETLVMTAAVNAQVVAPAAGTRIVTRTVAEGIADVHRLKGSGAALVAQDIARQSLWRGDEVYLALRTINGVAVAGLARAENGVVGLFNMRTAESQRGKGYATVLVAALMAWGRERGAHTAFLQVDCDNQPALAAYRKFGFVERYRYWYRVQHGA
jgi:N-acetylglutamate synthase